MDPFKATREQFTQNIISSPLPEDASSDWTSLATKSRALVDKLAHHPAMQPNLQQTYMETPKSKNKVYFMWDFMGRTLGMLYAVNPKLEGKAEGWMDVQSRSQMAAMLMLDRKPGMLNQMVESTYGGQKGQHPEFGEDILSIARELV